MLFVVKSSFSESEIFKNSMDLYSQVYQFIFQLRFRPAGMEIRNGPQLTDGQLYTPQSLFHTIRNITQDVPKEPNIKNTRKRNEAFKHFDDLMTENQVMNSQDYRAPRQFMGLKKIIQDQKIKSLIRNFVKKLKRNNINSPPVQFQPFQQQQKSWFEKEGFGIPSFVDSALTAMSIIQIVLLILFYTLSLVFQTVLKSQTLTQYQVISIFFYAIEMILGLIVVNSFQGRKLVTLNQISWNYINNGFPLDLMSILILIIDVSTDAQFTKYLRMIIIFKLNGAMSKLEKLENIFIDNFYKQQYWGLIKVVVLNFSFAHFLAIILIAMSRLEPHNNWITIKGWDHAPWYELYSWAYYWGTTIMLTVGFGDISATNFKEAICLTLIETFSCITLAYNINYVGNLIKNIRCQDIQKNKNHKIFNKLSEKNNLPEDLSWRINNYIEESANIKKKFNFQQENMFVSKLPPGLKADFLKQSNKKIFEKLIFFKNLTQKTLVGLAEKIQMRICHPEEMLRMKQGQFNIFILKQGHIGFVCKKLNFDFNDTLINDVKVKESQAPVLLDLGFIRRSKRDLEMKSLKYSILYCLSQSDTMKIMQSSSLDYQHYCQLRDKSQHILDENEIFSCELCGESHLKFDCPKLHYIPIQQHVITKELYRAKNRKAHRKGFVRQKKQYSTLRTNRKHQEGIEQPKTQDTGIFTRKMIEKEEFQRDLQPFFQFSQHKQLLGESIRDDLGVGRMKEQDIKMLDVIYQVVIDGVSKAVSTQNGTPLWQIECDQARNYKFYFSCHNASSLAYIYPGK